MVAADSIRRKTKPDWHRRSGDGRTPRGPLSLPGSHPYRRADNRPRYFVRAAVPTGIFASSLEQQYVAWDQSLVNSGNVLHRATVRRSLPDSDCAEGFRKVRQSDRGHGVDRYPDDHAISELMVQAVQNATGVLLVSPAVVTIAAVPVRALQAPRWWGRGWWFDARI